MGKFVDEFPDPPFDWGDEHYGVLGSGTTKELVEAKFNATMETAEDMLVLLVGSDGNSGLLGRLAGLITAFPAPGIGDFTVDIPSISIPPTNRPPPDLSGVDTDFPTFDKASPILNSLPAVDLSNLNPADLPAEITAAISWLEANHDTTLFDALMTRFLADLTAGATGLSEAVEQGIFDRERARLQIEEDKLQTEIEEYFASTGFDLPTGAKAARLQEHANGRAMRLLDLSQKIAIDQAELAQKNSQFIIQAAKDLEAVLRSFTDKQNDRSLDYAKAVAANAIAIYAENIKAYIAAAEANKAYVEVQVENLKAVVEYNKGLVTSFAAEAEAYGVVIEAKAKKNEAITETYKAEVIGYEAETRAATAAQQILIEEYRLRLQNGDMQLRAAIAEAESAIKAYEVESTFRRGIASDSTQVAMQALASALGAVNTSAGLSHSTGRTQGETFSHGETRGMDYNRGISLGETHNFQEEPST